MSSLMSPSYREHVMLLYNSDDERKANADPHYRAQHGHADALPAVLGCAWIGSGDCRKRQRMLKSVFNGGDAGFDLIILDFHLSDMPGLQVARRIKEMLPDQKIVITTTSIVEDTSINEIGIEEVMTKPLSFSKLLAMIRPSTV